MPPKITRKQRDTALTIAITVSSIGKDVADMLGVPFAKGAASILLNILNTIQKMEGDKQGCLELAGRAVAMLQERRKQLGDKWDAAPGLAVYLIAFETTLQEISNFMERLAATNFIKRLVYSNDIRGDLQKFGTMLSDANERLKTAILTEIYLVVVELQGAAQAPVTPLADLPADVENTPDDPSTQVIEGSDPQPDHLESAATTTLDATAPTQPAVEPQYASLSLLIGPLPMFDVIPPPLDSHILRLIDPSYLVLRRLEVPGSVDSIHHLLMNERVLPSLSLADGVKVQVGDLGYLPSSPYTADGFAGDFRKLCNVFEDGLVSYAVERNASGSAWATGGRGTVREPLDGIEMFDGGVRWTVAAPPGQGMRARVILSRAIASTANVPDFLRTYGDLIANEFNQRDGLLIEAKNLALITQTGHDQDIVLKKRGKHPSVTPPTYVHWMTSYSPEFEAYLTLNPNPVRRSGMDNFLGHHEILMPNQFIKFIQMWDDSVWNDMILAIMLPPSMPLTLFILAGLTLGIGMLLGWAWGAAAMAAALKARSQALLNTQLQLAQASLNPNVPVQLQFQQFIFQGRFLDARSSAIYGAFIFIGAFFLGALRGFVPNLALVSIFGLIVLDVMCSYGPLFYTSQYTIAKQFLLPTSYYLAIALASLVLIFPETLNHAWLSLLSDSVFTPTKQMLGLLSQALSSRPSDRTTWESFTQKGGNLRRAVTGGTQGLLGQTGLLDVEFSLGRLGPGDLKRISGEMKSLMFRTSGLLSFLNFVQEGNKIDQKEEEEEIGRPASSAASTTKGEKRDGTATPDRFTLLRRRMREHEQRHGHDLDSLVPILEQASAGLRSACDDVLREIIAWFDICNSRRWRSLFFDMIRRGQTDEDIRKKHEDLVALLERLTAEIGAFQNEGRGKLIEPYKQFFDVETGKLKETAKHIPTSEKFTSRSLFLCFVFCDTLVVFSERLARVMSVVIDLDRKRPKVRLWAPSGFGKIGRKLMKTRAYEGEDVKSVVPLSMGTAADPSEYIDSENSTMRGEDDGDEDEDSTRERPVPRKNKEGQADVDDQCKRRNPDALPPRTGMGRFAVRLGSFFRWFKSAEGIFALRTAVVTLALWIPAVVPSSAGFNYQHKGLWALIMAQTSLGVYAGDQIAGITGTNRHDPVGMAVWYIGAGSGPGNPYGIVVATTVFIAPFLYMRVVAPIQDAMIWILAGVTIIFVVGYSWIDTHLLIFSNSGVGVELGWRRALLVVIGFTAAFIVMLFPRPTSARTLVRRTVAASLEHLGRVFASEVDAILAEEAKGRKGIVEKPNMDEHLEGAEVSLKEKRIRKLAEKLLAVATRLQALTPSLTTGKWEPQLQTRLISCLALLAGSFVRLDTNWCYILVHKTPFLNPYLLADVFSTISVLSHALSAGHPVPASLPRLRDRLIYHDRHMFAHEQPAPLSLKEDNAVLRQESVKELDPSPNKVDGVTIGFEELTLDVLMDDQLPAHSTAVLAISSVLGIVDEIADIIRILCGETSFEGISALHQEYLSREEAMLYRPRGP
ncbi:hypothetical protein EYR36_011994 [Pleurotus pulmonarius]|nr:hypothetical protein EYR36_011994 [Pleurotus pulmonarius]